VVERVDDPLFGMISIFLLASHLVDIDAVPKTKYSKKLVEVTNKFDMNLGILSHDGCSTQQPL
jgi:hypothetical protein